jgi:hypothetical protein
MGPSQQGAIQPLRILLNNKDTRCATGAAQSVSEFRMDPLTFENDAAIALVDKVLQERGRGDGGIDE